MTIGQEWIYTNAGKRTLANSPGTLAVSRQVPIWFRLHLTLPRDLVESAQVGQRYKITNVGRRTVCSLLH